MAVAPGIFRSDAGQGAMGSWACWYCKPYRKGDLHPERTRLDATTALVKIGMNCHIMSLVIFIVDLLEMLHVFCMSVPYRGIWVFLLRYGGSTEK